MTTGRDVARPQSRRRSHDVRNQLIVVVLAALAGLAAAAFGTPRVSADSSDRQASSDDPRTGTTADADAETVLLTHVEPDGGTDLLVLLGLDDDSGSVLLIPTAALVEIPAFGLQTLADAPRLAGLSTIDTTIENALGVDIDRTIALDDATLAELIAPAGAITVDFRRGVEVDDEAGTVSFGAGEQEITAADAVRLLSGSDPAGELAHLVTVQAVIDGWRRALSDDGVADQTTQVADVSPFVRASGADLHYETLPVEAVSTSLGEERLSLRRDDVAALIERDFGWARFTDGERPKVEILNGTGGVNVAQGVSEKVVPAGVEVTLTNNVPGFGVGETVVVYYRDEDADAARRLVEVFGVGKVAKGDRALGVVDLTIVVGADFPLPAS
jgi:hypothetical protein